MSQGLTGVPQALSYTANVASATTVTLPNAPMDATYPVTGTTTITGITSGQAGRKARLIFQSAGCTVINGSNLKLAGRSFISTVNRMLTLVSDGTNWIEESRGDFGTTAPAALTLGGVTANGTVGESADIGHVHAFPIPAPTIAGVLGTDGTSAIWFPAPDLNINYNGAAEVQQGGSSFSALVSGTRYIDGWLPLKIGTGVLSVATTTSPTTVLATGHMPLSSYQFITTTTVDASIGIGDVYGYETVIEGWNARRLVAGSALSFWCYSTRGGTFTAFMQTYAGTHSYIREFVMPVNTWTYVTTTFPAWTAIDGNMSTNIGAYVGICMAGGTNFQAAKDTWITGSKIATSTMTNNMDTLSAVLYIANFNLVPGLTPLPYQPRDYEIELARAQRYRQIFTGTPAQERVGVGVATGGTTGYLVVPFVTSMAAAPTMTLAAPGDLAIDFGAGSVSATAVSNSIPTLWNTTLLITTANVLTQKSAISGYMANGKQLILEAYPT
jgi:hypothetical protein